MGLSEKLGSPFLDFATVKLLQMVLRSSALLIYDVKDVSKRQIVNGR